MVKVIHTGEEKRTAVFTVRFKRNCRVMLAGTFNEWNPENLRMNDETGDGLYSSTLKLHAGTYEYRFVIDGCWVMDRENESFTANEFGTRNSIVTIK